MKYINDLENMLIIIKNLIDVNMDMIRTFAGPDVINNLNIFVSYASEFSEHVQTAEIFWEQLQSAFSEYGYALKDGIENLAPLDPMQLMEIYDHIQAVYSHIQSLYLISYEAAINLNKVIANIKNNCDELNKAADKILGHVP